MSSSSKQLDAADMSFFDYVDSLRIPYEEIELATNNFSDKSLIPIQSPSSSFSPKTIYKGQLEQSGGQLLDIVARKFSKEQDNIVFNELVTSYLLKHTNIHSLLKICGTDEPIIISKYESNESLDKHLSDSDLTWMQRLNICLGVAHALSYIHDYEAKGYFSVIHGNIKSSKILLDDKWEPKLNCFGTFSMFVRKHQSHLISNYDGALQYLDPEYVDTGCLTHKSDVFSFGVVLFEVMFGEIASVKDEDNWYFAKLARSVYEEKTLVDVIDADLHQQMDIQSLQIFSEAAYLCLKEVSSQRPDMVQVVTKLETALSHQQKHATLIICLRDDLAHLKIPLENIQSATNNFADENVLIAGSGVGKEYKGEFLLSSELISIAAMRLSKERNRGELQFLTDVSVLSKLKHKNIISIVGFCDENGEKIIITKHDARGRLGEYLSDPMLLTWVRRLEICVGLSHALSYIYYDEARDFSVIHRNITSNTIVLNDDWEPKLSDFELSITIEASERHQSFHADTVWYPEGYTDPTYIETESAHHKSDVYSFGIVLFELLCGRKSIIAYENNKYFASLAIFHYREKTLDDIVDRDLWKQMDPLSFNILAEVAYACLNEERSQRPNIDEIVRRLEKALELHLESQISAEHSIVAAEFEGTSDNYEKESASHSTSTSVEYQFIQKTTSPTELNFEDIKTATNNFAPENIIKEKTFGIICQGRMFDSEQFIDIVAREIKCEYQKDESRKFRMEVWMLSSLKHKNLVSLIGFNDKNNHMITVYKKEANGSLNKYLSDETLTWMQRLKICVDIANAVSYIHYDYMRDFSVIHCNIKSSKILLDDNWEPKLSGFELALKNTVARRHRLLLTRDIVQNAYLDPKYRTTRGVTNKSDVYSLGVVLFEVLCGRSAVLPNEELEEGLLSQLATYHLDNIIPPHLRKQMHPEALKIFSETAYYCIQEERAKRPHMNQVVNKLEEALQLEWKRENPVDRRSSILLNLVENFKHLKIGIDLINEATKDFDDAYSIGSGGFAKVYKADLETFDSSNSSLVEGVNECDLPRKRSMVAIKRFNNLIGEESFIVEIEAMTSCKHENIISLVGFCYEGTSAMILVYEYASKGSLENYLGSIDKMNLTWVQRLNICLDIAHGLNYIHNNTDHGKQKMIHCDIKSDNIFLGDNWKVKIGDFGLSQFHPADLAASTFNVNVIAGTYVYLDPEYEKCGKLSKKSDIYGFGVVLLEVLTGKLAYDSVYTNVNERGIAPIARHHFKRGTIMEIVDHKIKDEADEHAFSFSKGPDKESLDIFIEIAFLCVAETQAQRPTIEIVIKELTKALNHQENHKDNLKLSLAEVRLATQDFSQENIIGHGDFGNVYRGIVTHAEGHKIIAAKRLDKKNMEGEAQFVTEVEILMEYKHENVISLVGYCVEEDEKIIVYEYASRGSLDNYLSDDSLTWVMRLKICIDIAIGLEFLHGTISSQEMVMHRDISSNNILLFDDWKAKLSDFGLSLVCTTNQDVDYAIDNIIGTIGYSDPLYSKTGVLTKESDIFSLGAVLFDILCGKLSSVKLDDECCYLPILAKQHYHLGKLDKLVFESIKEQILPQSYNTFTRIAFECLHDMRERRPTAHEVVIQLKKALEFQEDYDNWEPKLATDYKEIIQMSKCPEDYATLKKEDLYNIFSEGILLQSDKVLLSFVANGERNEMVSATMFSYINSCPHEWRSLPESRFEAVVEILDISNLFIEIKTRAQFLSPNVVYGVYLVFKFCDSRNFASTPMYVDLNYTKGHESLNAYFATWRDQEWMMIELYRFLNNNEDVVFEFLLECFSSFHCGDGAIYVEGIEFRAIEKVKHEIGMLEEGNQVLKTNFADQVLQLPTNFEEIFKISRNYDELFWLGEVNGKKLLMLSAKAALYKFSNVNLFTSTPSAQSRFQEVVELLPQRVFHINCMIKSQMLSPDTEYVCFLLFKLSENCQGMHCPVKVRDVLHQENNEAEFFYFSTPSPVNIHDITRVPKPREDGWMEIQVWKFDSACEFKDDDTLSMNMKFSSVGVPMSGLIVCGLEFRPV